MIAMRRGWMLVSVLLALLTGCAECAVAQAPLAVTTVQDTVYTASGAAASGTVLVSWTGFTTASGAVVPSGTTSVTIGTSGLLSITLAPNAGATPVGSYYTATFHLSDGSTSRQYWVIPVTVSGGAPVKLAAIQNEALPTSVAMQTVSKAYVDMAIAAAVTGHPADSSTPYVLKTGDTMTGPLVLPSINVGTLNATTITGNVDGAAIASGTVNAARLPVFSPSGSAHAPGVVPDPGATAGASRYLREDGTWDAPPGGTGGGSGTMATQNANAVTITGGTLDGTVIGGTTPAAVTGTTVTQTNPVNSNGVGFFTANGETGLPYAGTVQNAVGSVNNMVFIMQFHLSQPYSIGTVTIDCQIGLDGSSVNVGIYNVSGTTKLIDSGAISTAASACGGGNRIIQGVTRVTLPAGDYLTAWAATDTSTVRFSTCPGPGSNAFQGVAAFEGHGTNPLSGGVLPSTLGSVSGGGVAALPVVVWSY